MDPPRVIEPHYFERPSDLVGPHGHPLERPLRSKSIGKSAAATMEFKSHFANSQFVTNTDSIPTRLTKLDIEYKENSPMKAMRARSVSPMRSLVHESRVLEAIESRNDHFNNHFVGMRTSSPRRFTARIDGSPVRAVP